MNPCCDFCGFEEAHRVWGMNAIPICNHCWDRKMTHVLPVGTCDRCKNHRTLYRVINKNLRYCYPCFKEYKYKPPRYTAAQIVGKFTGVIDGPGLGAPPPSR